MPLVPKSASDANEFVPDGLDKWVRTWSLDYVSTEEVYWQIPGDKVDINDIPSRAFDTSEQRRQTQAILDDYHKILVVNPALNERLMELANERIRANPLRYYVWLPALRSLDMWVRPRTEMLPLNSRWWEYRDDTQDSVIATIWGVLNLLFLVAALMAILTRAASTISRHDVAVCCAALGLPRNAGEPRTALHPRMLPRRVLTCGRVDFEMEDVTSRCRLVLKGRTFRCAVTSPLILA